MRFLKIQLMTLMMLLMLTDRRRIELTVWVIAGVDRLLRHQGRHLHAALGRPVPRARPGQHLHRRQQRDRVRDNHHPAAALVHLAHHRAALAQAARCSAAAGLCVLSVLGSQSRGALLALIAMLGMLWLKSTGKFVTGTLGIFALALGLLFMPPEWMERMRSIPNYQEDLSALGRINAWWFAFNLANDHPIVGGGFRPSRRSSSGSTRRTPTKFHDAHSIFFEVLAEQGYVGLVLFVTMGVLTLLLAGRTIRMARGREDLRWASLLVGNAAGEPGGLRASAGSSWVSRISTCRTRCWRWSSRPTAWSRGSCARRDSRHATRCPTRARPARAPDDARRPRRPHLSPRRLRQPIRCGREWRRPTSSDGRCACWRATSVRADWRRGCDGCAQARLPSRSVAVTFDDGYADNARIALPILREERVPATFFIATAYLDGGRMWNDTVIEAVRRLVPGEHRFPHAGFETISVPHSLDRRPLVLDAPQRDQAPAAGRARRRRPTRSSGLAAQPLPGRPDDASRGGASAHRGGDGRGRPHPQPSDSERSQRRAAPRRRSRVGWTTSRPSPVVARRCSPIRTVDAGSTTGTARSRCSGAWGSRGRW